MLNILSAIKPSPYDPLVEKATSDQNTSEDWQQILEINDRVAVEQDGPKDCMRSIITRLHSDIPWVILQTLTLLDSLVSNCGKRFHLEICSRDFETELLRLIRGGKNIHPKVSERSRLLLKKWAQSKDFRKDPQLNLIPSLYDKLKSEGVSFHSSEPSKQRKSLSALEETMAKNPDYVTNAEEEAQLAKAIELSIQEAKKRGIKTDTVAPASTTLSSSSSSSTTTTATTTPSSLYPSFNMAEIATTNNKSDDKEPIKVRALYDFEAAEDNELTFKAGEIILVTDSSDSNWWKGSNHRGEGLFPANFVSTDLNAEPEYTPTKNSDNAKKVQFNEEVKVVKMDKDDIKPEDVTIDEGKIDELMSMLQEADPKSFDDPDELLRLEEQCLAMMPLIDQQMESIDKMNARLTSLNQQLSSALNLYHDLMKESFLMEQMASLQINPYNAAGQQQQQFEMVNGVMPQSSYMHQQPNSVENNYYQSQSTTSTINNTTVPTATASYGGHNSVAQGNPPQPQPTIYPSNHVAVASYATTMHQQHGPGVYQHSQMMMAANASPNGSIMFSPNHPPATQQPQPSTVMMTTNQQSTQAAAVPNLL